MQYSFAGKVVLITGAGSGLGEASARLLAKNGLSVMVSDYNGEAARRVADAINAAGGTALADTTDVAQAGQVEALVARTVQHFGALHYAVNSAGVAGNLAATGEHDIAEWKRVTSIDLDGVFYGMRYQIPAIINSGGGAIVNISSIAGLVGTPGVAPYVASKHGVSGLTKAAALDHSHQGIRINSVHPGAIRTPMVEGSVSDQMMPHLVAAHPIGRLGEPDEIAHAIAFLLSDGASYIAGAQIVVDGGYVAR